MKNKFQFKSIAWRLALKFTFIITLAIIALSVLFTLSVVFLLRLEKSEELIYSEKILEKSVDLFPSYSKEREGKGRSPETEKSKTPRPSLQIPYYVSFVLFQNDDENTVIRTNDPFLPLLEDSGGRVKKFYAREYFIDSDLNILYFSKKIDSKKYGSVTVLVSLNMDTDSSSKILNRIPLIIMIGFIPVMLISFIVSLFITKRTLRPVVEMTESAKRISSSNLSQKLPVTKAQNELDELAMTFNSLFEALESDFNRERQFTSDVSHELKTPVAVIAGQTNLLRRWGKDDKAQLDKSLDIIYTETKSMQAVIENLLQMSRLENGRMEVKNEKINVNNFFRRIKDETLAVCPEAEFNISCTEDYEFYSDLELLRQVFMVVISNSIKFVKENLCIDLSAELKSNNVTFIIKDNGQGFGEKVLPHVFERFYRGDESHTRKAGGAGLGLSIASTIINSLGGTISASDNDGAQIEIILPVNSL